MSFADVRLAEQMEQFDEMVEFVSDMVEARLNGGSGPDTLPGQLSNEERRLFGVAYKNAIRSRRESLRIIKEAEAEQKKLFAADLVKVAGNLKQIVQDELTQLCAKGQRLVSLLLETAGSPPAKVTYYKMQGDFARYLAEVSEGDEKISCAEIADHAYQSGCDIADRELKPNHSARIAISLNRSIFMYEVLNESAKAIGIARSAFELGMSVDEDPSSETKILLQLLRDNLTVWTTTN